jgi:hypothetical protein
LLKPDTVQQMVNISQHVSRKEWDQAQALFTEMQSAKLEAEGTHWMVSPTKRFRSRVPLTNIHCRLASSVSLRLAAPPRYKFIDISTVVVRGDVQHIERQKYQCSNIDRVDLCQLDVN